MFLHFKCSICLLSSESNNALMAHHDAPGFANANKRTPKHTHTQKPRANFPGAIGKYVTSCSCPSDKSLVSIIWMLSWSSNAALLLLPCCGERTHGGTKVTQVKLYVANDTKGFTCEAAESYLLATSALILFKQIHNGRSTCSQTRWKNPDVTC